MEVIVKHVRTINSSHDAIDVFTVLISHDPLFPTMIYTMTVQRN